MLSPADFPVDRAITDSEGFLRDSPRLPVAEIVGLHESGLSTDEDGETVFDTAEPEIPFGWHVIEADDNVLFHPEEDI